MWVRARAVWVSKAGNSRGEYEDAFWPERACREARIFRAAVADGATETSFSGLWSRLLVKAYARGRLSTRRWEYSLAPLQQQWQSEVARVPLPWYAEEKVRQGAFSSLLGLTLDSRAHDHIHWRALAIGDSCLFHVRSGRMLTSFPLTNSAEFDSRPSLLSTNSRWNASVPSEATQRRGVAQPGDSFCLLTDALACWFLAENEVGGCPWIELATNSVSLERFENWVGSLRAHGRLRNDDVTALTIRLLCPDLPDALANATRL